MKKWTLIIFLLLCGLLNINILYAGTDDFNGDGITDILWRQASTGKVVLWFMNADGTRQSAKTLITDKEWTVAGTGYFDDDEISDILWRSADDGRNTLWFMNADGTRKDYKKLLTDTSWTIVNSGDSNVISKYLPSSKTGTISGAIDLPSSGDYHTIATLAVTPSSSGYLQVFGRLTVVSTTGGEQCFYISRTDSSGAVQLSQKNYSTCALGNPGELNNVYPQGFVTAGTTLYFSLKAEAVGGSVQGAYLSALFIPAPNQLP